jgi:hypothetical protein
MNEPEAGAVLEVAGILEPHAKIDQQLNLAFPEVADVETRQQFRGLFMLQHLPIKAVHDSSGGLSTQNRVVQPAYLISVETSQPDQGQLRVAPGGIKTELVAKRSS